MNIAALKKEEGPGADECKSQGKRPSPVASGRKTNPLTCLLTYRTVDDKSVLFQATDFVIVSYGSNRKLTQIQILFT